MFDEEIVLVPPGMRFQTPCANLSRLFASALIHVYCSGHLNRCWYFRTYLVPGSINVLHVWMICLAGSWVMLFAILERKLYWWCCEGFCSSVSINNIPCVGATCIVFTIGIGGVVSSYGMMWTLRSESWLYCFVLCALIDEVRLDVPNIPHHDPGHSAHHHPIGSLMP